MLVLAADTVVSIGRRILPKPKRAMPRMTASRFCLAAGTVSARGVPACRGWCVAKRLVTSRVR